MNWLSFRRKIDYTPRVFYTLLSANTAIANQDVLEEKGLETITVTAQKRSQSLQEVPISIATLNGERFASLFSGGDDILALATRVPGLYAPL